MYEKKFEEEALFNKRDTHHLIVSFIENYEILILSL